MIPYIGVFHQPMQNKLSTYSCLDYSILITDNFAVLLFLLRKIREDENERVKISNDEKSDEAKQAYYQ